MFYDEIAVENLAKSTRNDAEKSFQVQVESITNEQEDKIT